MRKGEDGSRGRKVGEKDSMARKVIKRWMVKGSWKSKGGRGKVTDKKVK